MVEFETNMVTKMFENNSPTNEKMQEKEQCTGIKEIIHMVETIPTLRHLQIKNRERMKHFAKIFAAKNITKLNLKEHHY